MPDYGAPGVYIIERDFSQRLENTSVISLATMGFFNKGPLNEPTMLTTRQDLLNIFGKPGDISAKFWLPIATMLDTNNSVWVTRVEDSLKMCAGITIGTLVDTIANISGSDRVLATDGEIADPIIAANPQRAELYPLSYGSIGGDASVSLTTPLSAGGGATGGGFIEATQMNNQISVFSVGPGVDYENASFAIVNYDDYKLLQSIALSYSEAYTTAERQSLAFSILAAASAGTGLSNWIATSIVDISTFTINATQLNEYIQFEYAPRGPIEANDATKKEEFAFYEYDNGVMVRAYVVSPDPNSKDTIGNNNFANNIINNTSDLLRVFVGTSELTAADTIITSVSLTTLAGADALSTDLSTLEGEFLIQLQTNYANKLGIQFAALVDLDFATSIKQRMDTIAQNRKDCIALLNVLATTMINPSTGIKTSKPTSDIKSYVDSTLNVASSYSAIYANYLQVFDEFNEKNRWIPCTGHVANRMSFTFTNFDPWWAFAGFERGTISGVLNVAYNPSDEQQKVLYISRINPIVNFPGEGVIIMGQKTLQNYASNTDRINVRNLVIKIARDAVKFSRPFLFAQNDEITRAQFRAILNPYLGSIQSRRGLTDYRVICDETNNTQEAIYNHELNVWILIKPTPTAEFIKITIANVGGTLTIDQAIARGF
jgi:hypothetical protein